ncbi:MAG TPA: acyltransferase [Steroidobacteraceae bacterium]|jgi:peptidoglycan/LPS O-acetylase OafA/YrhL|nr:acyltransferase [Steroidobacteraceae bacterium]
MNAARIEGAPIRKDAARRIPSLDGIRATSMMLVFASHAGFARETIGGFGVNVFFFLSGFLITTLLRLEHEKTGAVRIASFWMRRVLRVLPPFYTVALGAIAIGVIAYPPGTVNAPSLIAELLFYSNYYGLHGVHRAIPGTGVVWSLAVEEHFYLLFPLLYVAMQKWLPSRRHQAWLLWGLCAAVLAWRCVLVFDMHLDNKRIYPTTDTRIDSILFGCALAVCNNPYADNSAPRDPAIGPGLWKYVLLPAAAAVLSWCVFFDDPTFQNTASFSVQGVALTVVFIAAIRLHDWLPFRVLNWHPIVYIGTLSYSLYLVHDVFLKATMRLWPHAHAWQRAVVALAASFVAALAIYVAIEKPCASLRKKLRNQSVPHARIVDVVAL